MQYHQDQEKRVISSALSSSRGLAAALADGAILAGSSSVSNPPSNLETVLKNRLYAYYDRLAVPESTRPDLSSIEDLQIQTAKESLKVVDRVQKVIDSATVVDSFGSTGETYSSLGLSLGTKDLALLRTLLSISFKWGLEPLFLRVTLEWPSRLFGLPHGPQIVDLTSDADATHDFFHMLSLAFSLVFPEGAEGRVSQTLITTTMLTRHIANLLPSAIALGWFPDSPPPHPLPKPLDQVKALSLRILGLLHPAEAIYALGSILSSKHLPKILYLRKACASLLSDQILRPGGVRGLLEAMFSADEASCDEIELQKLDQVAKTLNSPPANKSPLEYYRLIFPEVLKFLSPEVSPSYRRAAASVIFRAVNPQKPGPHHSYASSSALEFLHRPFQECLDSPDQPPSERAVESSYKILSALTVLISNTEPSPTFISRILSPILPSLYRLSYDLEQIKTADPSLKEAVNGLLTSWGKIVDSNEGSNVLWSIIEDGKDSAWSLSLEGRLCRIKSDARMPFSLLPDVPNKNTTYFKNNPEEVDLNLSQLYPDPVHLLKMLKAIDRADVSSTLFLRLLESYRDMKIGGGDDPMRLLHKLQIIVQMQDHLSEGTTSGILGKSDQLLSFIYSVLASAAVSVSGDPLSAAEVLSEQNEEKEGTDSDDEVEDSQIIGPDDELIETAITLLLSVLEANDISEHAKSILNDIFSTLEHLARKDTSSLGPLAREARLVITARLANAPVRKMSKQGAADDENPQEVYQKALKLLQDPILPVRAHGLLLLRQLATSNRGPVEKALIPSILSIFLQCVQDDDSYMFLNAVQGLAALANIYGKEIFSGLVDDYAGGLEGLGAGNLTQQDINVRTRIGEALGLVVKQCGNTLGLYVDNLVPRLFAVVRGPNIATTLRVSALSLLARCVDTYPWAMLPYTEDLCRAMVDLLQTESLPMREHKSEPTILKSGKLDADESPSTPVTMDSDPTSANSKFPPLRRAALHFLSLLIRASTQIVYDQKSSPALVSGSVLQKLHLTLGYVSSTDEDPVVRVMAREAKENLEQMNKTMMGL